MEFDQASAREFIALPADYALPSNDDLAHDARAILLHTLNLRTETQSLGIQIAPIWESQDGQAALRATVVPKEVEQRHFEGRGMIALRDPASITMIADVVELLSEEPLIAARVLAVTESLWMSKDAPLRPLGLPYKGHFKLLTLVMADFLRKIGADFNELEWLTSLALLNAYHDPDQDPPVDAVRASTSSKNDRLIAEEKAWMAALASQVQ